MSLNLPSSRHPKKGLHLKALSAAVLSALLLSNAYAAGLGKLTVLSALGQPLRAEIELTSVSQDETGALAAKLASPEAFRQANIEPGLALSNLRFEVAQRGARQVINVTSTQPLNEPFIDMLLELSGPHGRLVREYTFLLDPPELRASQSAQFVASPSNAVSPQRESTPITRPNPSPEIAQQVERPAKVKNPAAKPEQQKADETAKGGAPGEYKTKSGDTLSHIASRMKARGVSLDQMLVALYRSNPNAFVGENMNRLRAGQILNIPNAEVAKSISNAEAREIVLAQSVDFNNYRAKLAGQVAVAEPRKAGESKQSANGKITAKVEEPVTPDSETQDKLKLSKAKTPATEGKNAASNKSTALEDKIADDKAVAEANSRVKELEKNVNDLQKILEVKNQGLAEQQKQAEAANKPEAKPDQVAAKPVTPPAAPVQANAAKTTPAIPAKPKPVLPRPAPVAQPSFFDELLDNPYALPGVGALVIGIGALGILSARRRKQKKKSFEDSIITDSSLKANSLFGSTGGQSVDTNNSVFNSSFTPSVSQLDSNEVDPVAEADVYIAYGRDAQAEEILKEALRTQPDRHAVRVKLLEIYSNRKDSRAFEVLATELYGLTKGDGEDWMQAAAMGRALDPSNPLYADKATSIDIAPAPEPAPVIAAKMEEESELTLDDVVPAEPISNEIKEESTDLDFDLSGVGFKSDALPESAPRSEPVLEPAVDMLSIDFDFLDQPATAKVDTASSASLDMDHTAKEKAPVIEEMPAFSLDIPGLPEEPVVAEKIEPAPLEFDLSGINLELPSTSENKPEPDLELDEVPPLSATHAEMATKLDLALAYQEIGDKEGARELLDEVLKGGSPEQSQKAKSLLLELA